MTEQYKNHLKELKRNLNDSFIAGEKLIADNAELKKENEELKKENKRNLFALENHKWCLVEDRKLLLKLEKENEELKRKIQLYKHQKEQLQERYARRCQAYATLWKKYNEEED